MTSDGSSPGDEGDAGLATERDVSNPSALSATLGNVSPDVSPDVTLADAALAEEVPQVTSAEAKHLDGSIVEELTHRLPTSELVKIIKNALECGRRNVPFTESALLRAMTFGSTAVPSRQPSRTTRSPRN